MDKATVKLLLESYRPEDAADPIFAEALRELETDPELRAWFEEAQRYDAAVSARLRDVPIPADVKGQILGTHSSGFSRSPQFRRVVSIAGALAALFVIGLLCFQYFPPSKRTENPLVLRAIAYTEQMPPLQFVCFNAAAVANWINRQPAAHEIGLNLPEPGPALSMVMIGSSVVYWDHQPVLMICLQDGRRMAMLYVLKDQDVPANTENFETVQKAGWVVRTSKVGGQVHVLATKGSSSDLDFQMPF